MNGQRDAYVSHSRQYVNTNRDYMDVLTAVIADLDDIHTRTRTLADDDADAVILAPIEADTITNGTDEFSVQMRGVVHETLTTIAAVLR